MNEEKLITKATPDGEFIWITAIESAFLPQARHLDERPLDEYELVGHYESWEQDINLAKSVGAHAMRYSIPWYKVNPAPGVFDWEWADKALNHIVKNGMKIIADINHYNAPLWLDNEYLNSSFPERFAEYATEFAKRYKDIVHSYVPYNEPVVNSWFSGQIGEWPPYLHGNDGFVKIVTSLAKAIILERRGILSVDPDALFVEVEGNVASMPMSEEYASLAQLRIDQSTLIYDLITGRVDGNHTLYGFLVENGMQEYDLQWFRANKVELGIIGINYYPQLSHNLIGKNCEKWQEYPIKDSLEYLDKHIREIYKKYNVPMMLSETGYFGRDEGKIEWLEKSWELIQKLRGEGIPVIGYDWWFLLDSIGWDYKWGKRPVEDFIGFFHGSGAVQPRKTDGLFDLIPEGNGKFKRVRNKAADVYQRIAKGK
jgi:beta-glucosidase/6-phospho-beta-glucosidase/beta-galactosidase